MIQLNVHLLCDQCRDVFKSRQFTDVIFRRDLEKMRKEASARGWRRFRISNTSSNGDYCPKCQKKLANQKASKAPNLKEKKP